MSNILIGRVAPVFKGEYDSANTYNRLDIVLKDGSSYVCLQDGTTGLEPPSSNWLMVASKGNAGILFDTVTSDGRKEITFKDDSGATLYPRTYAKNVYDSRSGNNIELMIWSLDGNITYLMNNTLRYETGENTYNEF